MRMNKVTAILGRRGCGKTTYSVKFIKSYRTMHPDKKILVIDTLDHPLYREFAAVTPELVSRWKEPNIYRIFGSNMAEIFDCITNNFTNALILFEDAIKILDAKLQPEIKNLIIDSKQKNLDIIFIFHGFSAIPLNVLRYLDFITVFKTADNPKYRRQDITFYDELLPVWEKVMKDKSPYAKRTLQIT
jgi:hypothetical protein